MDLMEGRDVASCDFPGYFLQTDMEESLLMCIDGALVLLLVKLNCKQWRKHLQHQVKNLDFYLQWTKVIYGTIIAALLS